MNNDIPKKFNNLNNLLCPKCNNDNLLVEVDFINKKPIRAICIKKAITNIWGLARLKGCGAEFKLALLTKAERLEWKL